jgi:predicted PurR-regulated permease PerM
MQTNTKILMILLVLALLCIGMYTLFAVGSIVALALLAAMFAFILTPTVNYFERIGINRTFAALVVFLVFFGIVGIGIWYLSPLLYDQIKEIQDALGLNNIKGGVRNLERFLTKNLAFLGVRHLQIAPRIEQWLGSLMDNILNIASSIVGFVLFIVMMLISTFFLLKDGRKLKKSFISIVPNSMFEMTMSILHKIERSLGGYIRGVLLDALVIGCTVTFALWIAGVPNFILCGVIAGFANLVPYIGPPSAALITCALSIVYNDSTEQVILILIIFGIIRLLDDSIVQPLVISRTVHLHPVTIIISILVGGQLFGLLGMLFAVPVVSVLKVSLMEFYQGMIRYRAVQPLQGQQ